MLDNDKLLYAIVFFFKNLNLACNYEIYNKELLAFIRYFEEWKSKLEGTGVSIKIIINYKSLKYFMTTKKLIKRQAY